MRTALAALATILSLAACTAGVQQGSPSSDSEEGGTGASPSDAAARGDATFGDDSASADSTASSAPEDGGTTPTRDGGGDDVATEGDSDAASGSMPTSDCSPAWGSFGGPDHVFPPACWRPYAATSPFNRRLPASPTVASNSAAVVASLKQFAQADANSTPGNWVVSTTPVFTGAGTGGFPTYYPGPTDPVYTVQAGSGADTITILGYRVPIPPGARHAGPTDQHMTLLDQFGVVTGPDGSAQPAGMEYDMWTVQDFGSDGGTIRIGGGGAIPVDGDGLGSHGVAARYGNIAGVIRAQEMEAAEIQHALAIFVWCDNDTNVYPALAHDQACSSVGMSNAAAPPMGALFQFDMTDAEIDALSIPSWQKPVLHALADYGAYVSDTGGQWGFQTEGSIQYTSLGLPDPWLAFAQKNGWTSYQGLLIGNWVSSGIDWYGHLRMLDPCVAMQTCP